MKIIFLTAFFFGFLSGASAQRIPTEVELKSAYCIQTLSRNMEYFKNEITRTKNDVEATKGTSIGQNYLESLDTLENLVLKTQADLSRLRSFLIPRYSGIDIGALQLATNRAKNDWQLATNNSCSSKCNDMNKMAICLDKCDDAIGGPKARMWACSKIDFLPF